MDLSIIITSFNTKDLLKDCLASVFKHTQEIKFEVWVVDNASQDGSLEEIKRLAKKYQPLKLVANKVNFGFARANNQGIKKAKGKFILLLNSDTKITDNVFKKLVDFAKSQKKLGVVGPRLLNADGSFQPSTAPFYTLPIVFLSLFRADRFLRRSPSEASRVDWVSGSCFLIKRSLIEKIGLLDENFFMYIEESEFCYRAQKAGFETWFFPEAEVYHLVRGSTPEGKQKVIWWTYQGLIHFYQKHFSLWQLTVLKFLLRLKAASFWLAGILTNNAYLKQTYAKAFKLV